MVPSASDDARAVEGNLKFLFENAAALDPSSCASKGTRDRDQERVDTVRNKSLGGTSRNARRGSVWLQRSLRGLRIPPRMHSRYSAGTRQECTRVEIS